MKALCYLAALGQALIFAYCLFAVVLTFNVGMASTSDTLIAFLTPVLSGLSAYLLIKAAPLLSEEGRA